MFPLLSTAAGLDSARSIPFTHSGVDEDGEEQDVFDHFDARHLRGVFETNAAAISDLPALFHVQRREVAGTFVPAHCERWTVSRQIARRVTCKQDWLACSCHLLPPTSDAVQYENTFNDRECRAYRHVVSYQTPEILGPPVIGDPDYDTFQRQNDNEATAMRRSYFDYLLVESDGENEGESDSDEDE
jgi:hypothetical protein